MLAIHRINVWVHDQRVALEFWTRKVGFELRADATFPELGGFRWLTVGPPGQADLELVLMAVPEPPVLPREQTELIRAVMSQGLAGAIFLATDDVRRDHELLTARGSSSPSPPRRGPTASTPGSAIPRATRCG